MKRTMKFSVNGPTSAIPLHPVPFALPPPDDDDDDDVASPPTCDVDEHAR